MQTTDGIYLHSLDTIQCGHDIFDLQSHRVITRQKIIEIPIPMIIIKHIEEIIASEKVTFAKIQEQSGSNIYNNDWISGV